MKKLDVAKSIIKKSGGIAKTAQLNDAGIQNSEIAKMCENGKIERIKHGYYQIADTMEVSEEKMIATFLQEGIVCMESALFHYGYSDKTPLVWTIAVPRTITRTKLKIANLAYKVYFVQNDKLTLGKTEGVFNGVSLPVYDRERTICDCFKYRSKMDSEVFNKAINAYVLDEEKKLGNLSRYAKEMRVYKKVTELMEVMLNG
ncbi:MAG: type IV toxin-antitoxin system AbiEi family antitoxin domain-containing protein [Bacillota bacterium]|nr:type IV toxin-antitoxin system AbiEi family antitoxin domain-containing protein [Bacillota bacterium]